VRQKVGRADCRQVVGGKKVVHPRFASSDFQCGATEPLPEGSICSAKTSITIGRVKAD